MNYNYSSERLVPRAYFIPLNCFHTLEYYYWMDLETLPIDTFINSHVNSHVNSHENTHTNTQSKKSTQQKPKKLKIKYIPRRNLFDMECPICLESFEIKSQELESVKSEGFVELFDCSWLKDILVRIGLDIGFTNSEPETTIGLPSSMTSHSDTTISFEPKTKITKSDLEVCCLECEHIFHTECIIQWCNKEASCPLCRSNLFYK